MKSISFYFLFVFQSVFFIFELSYKSKLLTYGCDYLCELNLTFDYLALHNTISEIIYLVVTKSSIASSHVSTLLLIFKGRCEQAQSLYNVWFCQISYFHALLQKINRSVKRCEKIWFASSDENYLYIPKFRFRWFILSVKDSMWYVVCHRINNMCLQFSYSMSGLTTQTTWIVALSRNFLKGNVCPLP